VDGTGVTARVCAICKNHQGNQGTAPLRRAERHVRMLREQLDKFRARESEARAEVAEARKTVRGALASRGRLAAWVVDVADKAGAHAGPIRGIANDPDVRKWARRQDDYDAPWYRSSSPR